MSTQQKQLSSKELVSKVNETLFKHKFHHQIKNINISEKSGSQSFSSWERFKEPPYGYYFSKILESKLQNYPKEKSIYFFCKNQEVQLELENPKVVDLSILYFELMSLFVNDLSFAKINERDDSLHINLYKVTLDYRSISKQVAKKMTKVSVE